MYKYNNINSLICDIISTESVIAYHVDSQKAGCQSPPCRDSI